MEHASTASAGTVLGGGDHEPGHGFENVAQEKPAPLASSPPGRAPGTGCGSAAVTNETGSPGASVSARVAAAEDPENVYWQAAIITDKEVALEDHGGDNMATLTRDGAGEWQIALASGLRTKAQT